MGGRLLPVRMNREKLVEDKEKITEACAGTIPKYSQSRTPRNDAGPLSKNGRNLNTHATSGYFNAALAPKNVARPQAPVRIATNG